MAIGARQRSMKARQVAAHGEVIEANGQKGRLLVALSATRRKAVLMHVVALVAGNTEFSRTAPLFATLMASFAVQLIVRSVKREITGIVGCLDIRKTLTGMTIPATLAITPFVNGGLCVTACTLLWGGLEAPVGVAVGTKH